MKVYWTPFNLYEETQSVQISFIEPTPVYAEISKQREASAFLNCPAFLETCKNTFVIKSPWTFKVNIDRKNKYVLTNLPQYLYDEFVWNRGHEISDNDPYLISLPPRYVFYSYDDIEMEIIPCFLTNTIENIRVIPGRFNISKWIRPMDFACEIIDDNKEISFKENDPIFCVRFYTKNKEKVVLERVEPSTRLHKTMKACTQLKKENTGKIKHLKYLYNRAESFMNLFKQKEIKENKCPFDFLHRRK